MSALTHRECLRAAMLDAIGGEPCTDPDGERSMAREAMRGRGFLRLAPDPFNRP